MLKMKPTDRDTPVWLRTHTVTHGYTGNCTPLNNNNVRMNTALVSLVSSSLLPRCIDITH